MEIISSELDPSSHDRSLSADAPHSRTFGVPRQWPINPNLHKMPGKTFHRSNLVGTFLFITPYTGLYGEAIVAPPEQRILQ